MSRPYSFPNTPGSNIYGAQQEPAGRARPASANPIIGAEELTAVDNGDVEGEPDEEEAPENVLAGKRRRSIPTWLVNSEIVRKLDIVQDEVADYDNVLWFDTEAVQSWSEPPYSYTEEQVMFKLQYFEQVSQIKGDLKVKSILQKRKMAASTNDLDDLDPVRVFPNERVLLEQRNGQAELQQTRYPRGVPHYGFVLPAQPDTTRTWRNTASKGKTKIIASKPRHHEPLPIGTTCSEIIVDYPNHLQYEFLDAFIQHKLAGAEVWKVIKNTPTKQLYIDSGVLERQAGNFVNRRINRRLHIIAKKHGIAKAMKIVEAEDMIELRALGEGLRPGKSVVCSVANFEKKRKEDQEKTAAVADETERRISSIALAQRNKTQTSVVPESDGNEHWPKSNSGRVEGGNVNQSAVVGNFCGQRGRLGRFSFWSGFPEFETYMKDVQFADNCSLSYMQDLVSLDSEYGGLDEHHKIAQAQQMLDAFVNYHGQLRYQAVGVHQVEVSTPFSYETLIEQLEAEVAMVLNGMIDVHDLPRLPQDSFNVVKAASTQALLELHQGMSQRLATESLSKVLVQPPVSLTPEDLLHQPKLVKAIDLVCRTVEGVTAQSRGSASPRQKLYFKDATKNAVAEELCVGVKKEADNELPGVPWLGRMLDEARKARGNIVGIFQAGFGDEDGAGRIDLLGRLQVYLDEIIGLLDGELDADTDPAL